ncbi:DinB family protein [Sphingobacterium sp. SYP-B4668]|uniref:DinB family protein n=1 Tax=Sphingobacterium sp. SYP-B4668 TaxID=2996035 RepID=UPI0022DDEF34|nr:DinB family protein [Sphingobacterium sp. SYP-B4668]
MDAIFFRPLFDYSHYYNQQLSAIFVKNSTLGDSKSMRLFCHILNAHHIWNSRLLGNAIQYNIWDVHSESLLSEIDAENFRNTGYILSNLDLQNMVSYQTMKGQPFENRICDILFHVINHSTYHRGQIATDFRQIGIEPLVTDYIFWKNVINE